MMGMRNLLVLCSVIFIFAETATASAPIVIGRDDIIVEEGDSRDMICNEPVEMGVSRRITIVWSVERIVDGVGVDLIGYKDGRHLTYAQDIISPDRMKLRSAGRKLTIFWFQLNNNEFRLYCNIYTEVSRWAGSSTIQVFTYAHNDPQVLKGVGVYRPGYRKIGACTSGFAYPAPTIKIYQDGKEIGQEFSVKQLLRDNYQVTTVKLVVMNVTASDHNSEIRCQVFSGIPPKAHPGKAKLLSRIRIKHGMTEMEVTSSNRKEYYKVGEVVTFRCKYNGWPHPTITSFGPDKMPLNRIEVTITEEMHGQSINCTVLGHYGEGEKTTGLTIKLKSYLDEVHIGGPDQIDADNVQHLYCVGEGRPEPEYQWYLNGELLSKGANLTLEKEGNYSCTAANAAGQLQSPHHVVEMPEPEVPVENIAAAGSTVNLTCKVDIDEGADYEVTWSVILTHSNTSTHILTFESKFANNFFGGYQSSEQYFTMSPDYGRVLHIDFAQSADSGMYECRVSSVTDDQVETAHIYLEVREFYETWENPEEEVTVAEGDRITLECPVVAHPHPTFTWTREDGAEGPRQILNGGNVEINESWDYIEGVHTQTTSRLTIQFGQVDEHFSAIYKCNVENVVGSEEKKFQLSAAEVEQPRPTTHQWTRHDVTTLASSTNPTTTMSPTTSRTERNTTTHHYDVIETTTPAPSPSYTSYDLAEEERMVGRVTTHVTTMDMTSPYTTQRINVPMTTTAAGNTTSAKSTFTGSQIIGSLGEGEGESKTVQVSFRHYLSSVPVVEAWTVGLANYFTTPTFQTTISNLSSVGFTATIGRTDAPNVGSGWGQNPTLNWLVKDARISKQNDTCEWTEWMNSFSMPDSLYSHDDERMDSLRKRYTFCQTPADIQCFDVITGTIVPKASPDGAYDIICWPDFGLRCLFCNDHKVRFQCCGAEPEPEAEDPPMTSCILPVEEKPSSPTTFKNGKSRFKFSVYQSKAFVPRDDIRYSEEVRKSKTIAILALKTPGNSRGKKRRRSSIGRSVKIREVGVHTFQLFQDEYYNCGMPTMGMPRKSYPFPSHLDECNYSFEFFTKAKRRVKVKIPIRPHDSGCPLIVRLKITAKDGRIFYDEIDERDLKDYNNFQDRPLSLLVRPYEQP